MSNLPSLSIITVCKNAAATIAMTIDSVLSQQAGEVEYIVIDGNSTDGTCAIVQSYGASIDKFICEPDGGIADAFNKGIERASGDIIGFVNADDQLLPGALAEVAHLFETFPEVDVFHGNVLLYDGDEFIKQVAPADRWWYPWRLVLFNHPSTFVRKRVYERYGQFDTSFLYAMDDELYLRWIRGGVTIRYLSEPLVRMQAGGASGRNTTQVFVEKRRALLAHGYPRLLVELQFVCRFAVQMVAVLQSKWRKRGEAGARQAS